MTPASVRGYRTALLVLVVGGVVLLLGFGLTWASAQVPLLAGGGGGSRPVAVSGRDLFPGAAMSGWVALAAVAGLVATRSWGRIAVGVVTVAAGSVTLVAVAAFVTGPAGRTSAALAVDGVDQVTTTAAWAVVLIGALAVLVAGGWAVLRGRSWPALGDRFDRTGATGPARGKRTDRGRRRVRDVSAWEAQDAGVDPTDDLVE